MPQVDVCWLFKAILTAAAIAAVHRSGPSMDPFLPSEFHANPTVVDFSEIEGLQGLGRAMSGGGHFRSSSLMIYLTAQRIERAVRGLLPFYGVNCPVAVYKDREPASTVVRGRLGALEGWKPSVPIMLLIGGAAL